jgi:hypothetical protein
VKKTDNWNEVPLIAEDVSDVDVSDVDVSDVDVRNGIEMIHLKMDNIPDYYYLHCCDYCYDYCCDYCYDYEVLDYRFGIRYNWDKEMRWDAIVLQKSQHLNRYHFSLVAHSVCIHYS